jgi:hypothetical protein
MRSTRLCPLANWPLVCTKIHPPAMFNYDSVPALAALNLYTTGSEPAARREEVDEHMARHIEAGWKLAFYSTNATATGTVHHFIWQGRIFKVDG